jgi:hypothetical protein
MIDPSGVGHGHMMRGRRKRRHWAIEILRWTAMLFYIVGGLGSLIGGSMGSDLSV